MATLKHLRQARRSLRAGLTSLRSAAYNAPAYADALHLLENSVKQAAAELDRRMRAEADALQAPHPFMPPRQGIWCVHCGAVADRHPPVEGAPA